MHFSSGYLALALSLATGTLAHPAREHTGTGTGPSGPMETGDSTVPPACKMFKPYVAEVFLEAVCSMHLTPLAAGIMPTINTACLMPQETGGYQQNTDTYGQNTQTYPQNTWTDTAGSGPTTTYGDTGPTDGYQNTGTGTGNGAQATFTGNGR
ncbi:MAG: hypothetical protein Q9222_005880, partial [Ikaeria aurantiellina]